MSVSRVYRLLRLITMLQSGQPFTAEELANELEVSRRTIFRDLNMLEMAHIPYYFDAEKGGYRISQHFFLPPVNLTLGEALSLLMLSRRLRGTTNLPLLHEGAKAAVKLESVLPDVIRDHVGSVLQNVSFSIGPTAHHDGLDSTFSQLASAIATRNVCRIAYVSFQEQSRISTEIHPLKLVFKARAWYLVAFSVKHGQVRTFKLGRIGELAVTGRTFDPPAFDLQSYFGDAWNMIPEGKLYNVKLRFLPKVAANVAEVQWHRSQQMQFAKDGSAEFTATVDGLNEITWWILGYGDQVEVLGPPSLRRRVAQAAARMVAIYAEGA